MLIDKFVRIIVDITAPPPLLCSDTHDSIVDHHFITAAALNRQTNSTTYLSTGSGEGGKEQSSVGNLHGSR